MILLLGLGLGLLWQKRMAAPRPQEPPPSPPAVFVGVGGAVPHPGVYIFPSPPTLEQLYQAAGLPRPPARLELRLATGEQIEVQAEGGFRVSPLPGAVRLTLGLPVDLNRATAADLEAVPGLGPVLAERLVHYRETHGIFHRLEQLLEVPGFGADKLEQVRPYLAVKVPDSAREP